MVGWRWKCCSIRVSASGSFYINAYLNKFIYTVDSVWIVAPSWKHQALTHLEEKFTWNRGGLFGRAVAKSFRTKTFDFHSNYLRCCTRFSFLPTWFEIDRMILAEMLNQKRSNIRQKNGIISIRNSSKYLSFLHVLCAKIIQIVWANSSCFNCTPEDFDWGGARRHRREGVRNPYSPVDSLLKDWCQFVSKLEVVGPEVIWLLSLKSAEQDSCHAFSPHTQYVLHLYQLVFADSCLPTRDYRMISEHLLRLTWAARARILANISENRLTTIISPWTAGESEWRAAAKAPLLAGCP